MSGQALRFAILGCGSIATTHARALAALAEGEGRLAVCADVVEEKARKLAGEFGARAMPMEEMLAHDEVDAVIICTPSGLHAANAISCLQAGKHVLIEKPMDVTLEACDRLLAARDASGRALSIISQHRFDPATRRVKALLDEGRLGRIFYAEARIPWYREQEYYDSGDWRGTWAMDGGGCLVNQGVHTVDLMRWLAGPLRSVFARAATAAHERIEVEDLVVATLEFESGALGHLLASTAMYPGNPAALSFYGSEGSAIIEGDRLQMLAIKGEELQLQQASEHARQVAMGGTRAATAGAGAVGSEESATESLAWGDAHLRQIRDFIRSCRTGDPPAITGEDGRAALEVVLAVYEAARRKEPLAL